LRKPRKERRLLSRRKRVLKRISKPKKRRLPDLKLKKQLQMTGQRSPRIE